MMNEFRVVWPKIAKTGLIISDDVELNKAFTRFARETGANKVLIFNKELGVILK